MGTARSILGVSTAVFLCACGTPGADIIGITNGTGPASSTTTETSGSSTRTTNGASSTTSGVHATTSGAGGASSGGSGGSGGNGEGGGPTFLDDAGTTSRVPPTISKIEPLTGDYGVLVTLTGDHLNASGATLVLASPKGTPLTFTIPTAPSGNPSSVIKAWSQTEIQFRYPFPAEGSIVVKTSAGQATGGAFVPSWSPGQPLSGTFAKAGLLDVTSPATGKIVAAFDHDSGPVLLVADGSSIVPIAFDRGSAFLNNMQLVSTAAGEVHGFFAVGTIRKVTLAGGATTVTDTGIALTPDRPIFAAGIDTTGEYVWARKTAGQLVRLRAPSWAQDGLPMNDPSGHKSASAATSSDGSLFVVWGNDVSTFLDDYSYPVATRVRPPLTVFPSSVKAGPGADDYMMWTRARAADSGEVVTYYCASDTGFGSPTTDCDEGYLDATGTSQWGARIAVGFGRSGSVLAKCDDATSTLTFGPTANSSQQVGILFPCPAPLAAAVDPSGTGLLLVTVGTDVYAPRKR
jgi:hypothetical protein